MTKFSLLLLGGLITTVSATAGAEIVFDQPSGEAKTYDLSTKQIAKGETLDFSGILATLVFDGDNVWFQDPVTAYGFGSWIKGERDGNKIRVKNGQMIYHQDEQEGYPELDIKIESGDIKGGKPWSDGAEYAEFTVLGDGTIVLPEGKALLATDQYGGVLASNNGYYFRPVDIVAELVTPPENLKSEKYCLKYRQNIFDEDIYRLVDVAHDDNNFYIKGLCGTYAPEGWSRGRRDGDYVKFNSGQFQGIARDQFLDYMYGGRYEMGGSLDGFEPERFLTFSYSSADRILSSEGIILETIGDKILGDAYGEPELRPYTAKEAVPAKPLFRGYTEYPEFTVVRFKIPPVDEAGDYIDPAGITWRLIVDGKPYIFTTDVFHFLSEDKEVFKWGEVDGERGMDIVFESCGLYNIWFYEPFYSMVVETTFTHDGKSHTVVSDALEMPREGIEDTLADPTDSSTATYTIDGRRAIPGQPGITITTTAGGRSTAAKTINR